MLIELFSLIRNFQILYFLIHIFSNNKREDHVKRHGNKEMGLTTNQYLSKALAFANKADYENHDSFVVQSGKTFKYSFKTKSFQ